MTTEPKRRALKWIGTRLSDHRAELVEVRRREEVARQEADILKLALGKRLVGLGILAWLYALYDAL